MAANNDVKENEITQASAQATLANLKEIRVVTMDGSSKAYGKADFMAVIAAGIKSYFSSIAAGNIAGILTADSGKAGISALADVAQVLGDANIDTISPHNTVDLKHGLYIFGIAPYGYGEVSLSYDNGVNDPFGVLTKINVRIEQDANDKYTFHVANNSAGTRYYKLVVKMGT